MTKITLDEIQSQRECKDFKDNIDGLTKRLNINNGYGNNNLQSWLIDRLEVKSMDKVLDIGCGDGRHLHEISKLTENNCIGIDYDEKMIEKSKLNSAPHLSYFQYPMDKITSRASVIGNRLKFNLIYSLYAFYYSEDSIALLSNLTQKLEENGRLAITGPYGDNNKGWFEFLNQYVELDESIMKSSYSFMDNIQEFAYDNFENVTTDDFINTITLPSYEDLETYWKSNIYYDSKYDSDFEKYAKEHFDNNETFSYIKRAKMVIMSRIYL